MPKKRTTPLEKDVELEAAVQRVIKAGIPLSKLCQHADINQATLWRWRQGKSSPVTVDRNKLMATVQQLTEAGVS